MVISSEADTLSFSGLVILILSSSMAGSPLLDTGVGVLLGRVMVKLWLGPAVGMVMMGFLVSF